MLITRATRHDNQDLEEFYAANEWEDPHLADGVSFVAREGTVQGALSLIELEPQTVVIEDVLVAPERRGNGLGTQLMQAALNSRGGTMFLCCHSERLPFYNRLGFSDVPFEELPEPVQKFMRDNDAFPFTPDHVHYFMKAR
jgi:N-acetylglutamate synthase-like GNAT family acetyltransferase